jgi:hypothetical protein
LPTDLEGFIADEKFRIECGRRELTRSRRNWPARSRAEIADVISRDTPERSWRLKNYDSVLKQLLERGVHLEEYIAPGAADVISSLSTKYFASSVRTCLTSAPLEHEATAF